MVVDGELVDVENLAVPATEVREGGGEGGGRREGGREGRGETVRGKDEGLFFFFFFFFFYLFYFLIF